ncbi:MAG: TMEM175 family protein [Acidobacteriota bacterium]|nr:TMEM175 family protein [Acidobacteriota bacterium]
MSRENLSPARLEAFSDGVIAVIITIMVLELKVPAQDGLAGVRAVMPTVFLYLLTFVQVGIYWVNHHYLVDETKTVSHGVLWANLFFLFFLSLFPFVTLWIGAKGLTHFSTALYAVASLLPGVCYAVLATQIRKQSTSPPHSTTGKQNTSIVLYLLAIPAAYWRPAASMTLIAIVSLLWLLPPRVEESDVRAG